MTEVWRPAVGYPDYEVSDIGRVRRATPGRGTFPGRVLGQRLSTTGYPTVMVVCPDGKARPRKVHQLVADAFVRVRAAGEVVNHLDGSKTNNAAHNLEVTDRAGNLAHAMRHGLIRTGFRHGMAKLSDEQVRAIRAAFSQGVPGAEVADRFGISRSYAYHIKQGLERKSA